MVLKVRIVVIQVELCLRWKAAGRLSGLTSGKLHYLKVGYPTPSPPWLFFCNKMFKNIHRFLEKRFVFHIDISNWVYLKHYFVV